VIGNKGNINMPHITGMTDSEKITQIIRFLYQLVDQLNWSIEPNNSDVMSFDVKSENGVESIHLHLKKGQDTYTVRFAQEGVKYSKNNQM
jgi:hypothetical protein